MESQTLSLEESLKCFEEGVSLTRQCQKALSEAEQKVIKITQSVLESGASDA
jgi:exodeoxyribonuclease VII small subunit